MIAGTSLIQRVYERAIRSRKAAGVVVATDDDRIAEHVISFGGTVVRPLGDFRTGTDRIAAALPLLDGAVDQVINVQGDEPLIDVDSVDRVIDALQVEGCDLVTLACPISGIAEFHSTDIVKVVLDHQRNALYFSRSPIPHGGAPALRHIGLYGYQKAVLQALAALPPSALEQAESLEQLRALQNGFKIRVLQTASPHLGVDRPEDVERVEHELEKQG